MAIGYDEKNRKWRLEIHPETKRLCAYPADKAATAWATAPEQVAQGVRAAEGYAVTCYDPKTLRPQSGPDLQIWDAPTSDPKRKLLADKREEASVNLQELYKKGIVKPEDLQDLILPLRDRVGNDAACVILAWMGGVPPDGFFEQYYEWNPSNTPDKFFAKYVPGTAALGWVAGWLGKQQGGGKIYTMKDACPNGPSIDVALEKLKKADLAMYEFCAARGQATRDKLARQIEATGDEATAKFFKTAGDRVGDVLGGLDSLTAAFGMIARNIVPIGIGLLLLIYVFPALLTRAAAVKTEAKRLRDA